VIEPVYLESEKLMFDVATVVELRTQRQDVVNKIMRRASKRAQRLSEDMLAQILPALCFKLLKIAQRHIPTGPLGTRDRINVMTCLKSLQELGLRPPIAPSYEADAGTASKELVTSSPAYRSLYNQTVACLATIADLVDKASAPGSAEFQRGVREGYRRASDAAVQFLTDIQNEVEA
jgi:hypothetical protein